MVAVVGSGFRSPLNHAEYLVDFLCTPAPAPPRCWLMSPSRQNGCLGLVQVAVALAGRSDLPSSTNENANWSQVLRIQTMNIF